VDVTVNTDQLRALYSAAQRHFAISEQRKRIVRNSDRETWIHVEQALMTNPLAETHAVRDDDWDRLQQLSRELARWQAPRWRLWLLTHCLACWLYLAPMLVLGMCFLGEFRPLVVVILFAAPIVLPLDILAPVGHYLWQLFVAPSMAELPRLSISGLVSVLVLFLYYRQCYRLSVSFRFRELVWESWVCLFGMYPLLACFYSGYPLLLSLVFR
jgi:hypothetical protein